MSETKKTYSPEAVRGIVTDIISDFAYVMKEGNKDGQHKGKPNMEVLHNADNNVMTIRSNQRKFDDSIDIDLDNGVVSELYSSEPDERREAKKY